MSMDRKLIIFAAALTVIVSAFMINANPVLFTEISDDFTEGEIFVPQGEHYDFGAFSMNVSNCSYFKAEIPSQGYARLMGGNTYSINVLQYDRMLDFQAKISRYTLEKEMKWPYQVIDGVKVYKADFKTYQRYGSFVNNGDLELYITSGDANETVRMVKSVKFSG